MLRAGFVFAINGKKWRELYDANSQHIKRAAQAMPYTEVADNLTAGVRKLNGG